MAAPVTSVCGPACATRPCEGQLRKHQNGWLVGWWRPPAVSPLRIRLDYTTGRRPDESSIGQYSLLGASRGYALITHFSAGNYLVIRKRPAKEALGIAPT